MRVRRIATIVVAWCLMGIMPVFAGKKIVVDLSKQEAYAYEDGELQFSGWISTGKPGHRTPTGHFRVLEKDIDHVSSKYPEPNGGAEMHYMLRLTDYGVAMHLGYVPNYPASHGCIRMENGFAQKMFRWAPVGTRVVIKGSPPSMVNRPISRNAPRVARHERTGRGGRNRRKESSFGGNRPLKLLSSVPGKRESVLAEDAARKKKRSTKRKKTEYTENKTPKTPLEALKG